MSNLFAVKSELSDSKFELKVNDVRFVGHPVKLDPAMMNARPQDKRKSSTIILFNIVFALKVGRFIFTLLNSMINCHTVFYPSYSLYKMSTNSILFFCICGWFPSSCIFNWDVLEYGTVRNFNSFFSIILELQFIYMLNSQHLWQANLNHDVVNCYHDLSKRLGLALRHEEYRCQFFSSQVKIMQLAHDEVLMVGAWLAWLFIYILWLNILKKKQTATLNSLGKWF